jgi:hypothetical protein
MSEFFNRIGDSLPSSPTLQNGRSVIHYRHGDGRELAFRSPSRASAAAGHFLVALQAIACRRPPCFVHAILGRLDRACIVFGDELAQLPL